MRHDPAVSDDDLPGWKFSVEEVTNGVYRAEGVDRHGRSVGATGPDADALLAKVREYAHDIANDVPGQDRRG